MIDLRTLMKYSCEFDSFQNLMKESMGSKILVHTNNIDLVTRIKSFWNSYINRNRIACVRSSDCRTTMISFP